MTGILKISATILLCICMRTLCAQVLFTADWAKAGMEEVKFEGGLVLNMQDYGADPKGVTPSDVAFKNALTASRNQKCVLYFPPGKYLFNQPMAVERDELKIRGASYTTTQLIFDLKTAREHCINLTGTITQDSSIIISEANRGSNRIKVYNATRFKAGDWVHLTCGADNIYMDDTWAYGSLGQVLKIDRIVQGELYLSATLRFNYTKTLKPYLRKIQPRRQIGVECLNVTRTNATGQASNILMQYVVNSWITGIESNMCDRAHVNLSACAHIDISNNYLHHAFAYGGGGQAYGVVFEYSTNQCKAENNIFDNLRHGILIHGGANGNVVAYNYMINPFWSQFPNNAAGDIVLHGNFPFANLIEGNINQNTVIDNAHGANGPFNTFFRNRSELFGVYVDVTGDSTQIIQHEITNNSLGFYIVLSKGNVQLANRVRGAVTPEGSTGLNRNSLYLADNARPLCYDANQFRWPYIGAPFPSGSGSIPARNRFSQQKFALCTCETISTSSEPQAVSELRLFPNPGQSFVTLEQSDTFVDLSIYDINGRLVFKQKKPVAKTLDLSALQQGTYIIIATDKNETKYRLRWLKI